MQKYFDSVFGDALGLRPIAGASVTVRMPNGSLASIFSDNGITPKANPVVTDSTGYFDFYAADGKYNLTITAAGFATQIRNDVILEDPAEASPGTFTTLAVTSNSTLGGPSSTTTIGGAGVVTNGLSVLSGEFSVNGTGVISASSTGAALRITQTGTGEALRVEDEANPDATPFVVTAAGNVLVGTSNNANNRRVLINGTGTGATYLAVGDIAQTGNEVLIGQDPSASLSYLISTGNTFNLAFATNGAERMRLDPAGNLGLGVTPSAWNVNSRALDIGLRSAISTTATSTRLWNNAFEGSVGGAVYKFSAPASLYLTDGGQHSWFTAPSGTAGAPITFTQAMTLTSGGALLLGATTPATSATRLEIVSGISGSDAVRIRSAHPNDGVSRAYGEVIFSSSSGGQENSGASISSFAQNVDAGDLRFSTSIASPRTERARITSAGNLRPGADNAYSLGEPTFRWSVVYAATGTINTSDVRAKLDFAPTFGLDFINALEPVSYRYKNGKTVIDQVEDGVEEVPAVLDDQGNEVTPATTKPKFKSVERVVEGTRRHHGLKAQQVKSVLDTLGVDFAGWVMDDPSDPESQQGLRYDQFIAPLIKAVQELSARVAELESRA